MARSERESARSGEKRFAARGGCVAKVKYKREYCAAVIRYFAQFDAVEPVAAKVQKAASGVGNAMSEVGEANCGSADGYPSLVKFALAVGVTPRTLTNWRRRYPEFDEACEFADEIQDDVLNERALLGRYDGRVAMKIRELKLNARRLSDGDGGARLTVTFGDDPTERRLEIKRWSEEVKKNGGD